MAAEARESPQGSDGRPCELLAWDSAHFGFEVAQVSTARLSEESASEVDRRCRELGVRCCYLRADDSDADTARVAWRHGYRQVDQRRTIRHGLEGIRPVAPPGWTARRATDEDLEALCAMARRSHGASRFYFDERFSRDHVHALYEAWVRRGVEDPRRFTLVAEHEGAPGGYQVVGPLGEDGTGRLELVAIDERRQGVGAGAWLVAEALRGLASLGATSAVTALQVRNVESVRLHERLGFLTESAEATYHKWF
jgi:GNAT superfamily N-acetyltransferase